MVTASPNKTPTLGYATESEYTPPVSSAKKSKGRPAKVSTVVKPIPVKPDPTQTYFKRILKNKGPLDRKFMLAREKYKKARKWMAICKDDFTAITNEML